MGRKSVSPLKSDANINYTSHQSMRAFHRSDAFFRCALGPVGCYSGDTEFLSSDGWKRIDQWNGERVTEWNPDTGSVNLVNPSQYIKEPCNEFIQFHNEHSLDMVLSEEHRMPLYDYRGKLQVKLAADVERSPSRYTVPTTFKTAQTGLPFTDAELRVMVMCHADGYMHSRRAGNTVRCAVQVYKPRKAERAEQLLNAADIHYNIDVRDRDERSAVATTLTFIPPALTKTYAGWWGASQAQLEIIVDEIQYWDGLYEGRDRRYYSNNKADADFIQYAVHACGGRASISTQTYEYVEARDTENWKPSYVVHIALGSAKSKVMLRGDTTTIKRVASEDGFKYCFTVPSSFLLMRRNGRVFISGNSGKSSATWVELFRRACEEHVNDQGVRSSMHLVIRDTYAMLKSTSLDDFKFWFGHIAEIVMDSPIRIKVNLPLADGTTLDWNLRLLSMDGGEKSLATLRGMQISGAYLNEAYTLPEEVYAVVASRVGRYRPAGRDPKWKGIIADSNYGYQKCHLHKLYVSPPEDYEFFEQPPAALWNARNNRWELNPFAENLQNLPGGMDYYKKMLVGMGNNLIKQFLGNQWASRTTGKQVWPEYLPSAHLLRGERQYDRNLPLILGQDFGLHAACVIGQLTPLGKLVVLEELWDDDVDLETFIATRIVPTLRNKYPGMKAVLCGDPSGMGRSSLDKRTAFDLLKKAGIVAFPAVTNEFIARRDAVKKFLLRNHGFQLHHSCDRLIAAMEGGYGYKKKQDGEYSDQPEKNEYSHVADALQYLALYAVFGNKTYIAPAEVASAQRKAALQKMSGRGGGGFRYA